MIYIIIKKSTGFASTEDFASVTEDIDAATFECAKMNMQSTDPDVYYYIQGSDSEPCGVQCHIDNDELVLTDGEVDIPLTYNEKICFHEDRSHEEGPINELSYIEVTNIKMLGTHIDDLAISEELKEEIYKKAEELGRYITKNK
jgi:hypothetical protein